MKIIFKLIILSLLIFSCESPIEPDLPPTVSILSPLSGQSVSGLVPITVSTDDDWVRESPIRNNNTSAYH